MTDLEEFENWLYVKHCCIPIRRESSLGICLACEIQHRINDFKEYLKEKK